jgi:hypothetical protein
MKNLVMTLVLAVSTLPVFARGTEVNPKVLTAFNDEFKTAREVKWTIEVNYTIATFTYNEKHVFAYYDNNGELLGLTRYVALADLPLMLQANLKNQYSKYWISELYEVANNDGTAYYATVENADTKLVLKATDGKTWNSYKKYKKS